MNARLIYNGIEAWLVIKPCMFDVFQKHVSVFEKKGNCSRCPDRDAAPFFFVLKYWWILVVLFYHGLFVKKKVCLIFGGGQ